MNAIGLRIAGYYCPICALYLFMLGRSGPIAQRGYPMKVLRDTVELRRRILELPDFGQFFNLPVKIAASNIVNRGMCRKAIPKKEQIDSSDWLCKNKG